MAQGKKNPEPAPEVVEDVCSRLLSGESTVTVSKDYGMSNKWAWNIAKGNGLQWVLHGPNQGQWVRADSRWAKDQQFIPLIEIPDVNEPTDTEQRAMMNDDAVELTADEYESLLQPESHETAEALPFDDDDGEMAAIQKDIAELMTLLRQATTERATMNDEASTAKQRIEHLESRVQELSAQVESYRTKATRYDEVMHQQKLQKIEASRRLLRQAGDDLRGAMAVRP